MSLQVWLPMNKNTNIIPDISSFRKESTVSMVEDSDGWYKISDSTHGAGSRWGIYYDVNVRCNTSYTLLVYSKSTTGVNCSIGVQSYQAKVAWPAVRETNNGSEKLTTYTWTSGDSDTVARIYLAVATSDTIANNYVFYKNPMLIETPTNQGIYQSNFLNSNLFNSNQNGKLGYCLKTSTAAIDLLYSGGQINTGDISFGGWFKINKAELLEAIDYYTWTDIRKIPTGNLIGNNSYGGVGLIWTTNDMYASGGVLNTIVISSSIRSTSAGARNTTGKSITFDEWHHLFLTFDKVKNLVSCYVDGTLASTTSTSDFSDATTNSLKLNYAAVWGGNGPAFNIPIYVNDIRIYDNCLSPMEVKELSKGLVLHYPLSDKFLEGTTNLITTEDCLSSTCYNGATSKYSYGTNTDMYKTVTTYDGRKGTKVYMGTNGNAAFPYVYINNMYTSDGTNSPAYKTLSFDYYTNIGTSIRPYKLGSGSGTATYRITNKNGVATGTGTDAVFIPVVTNGWNHIEITFHGTTAADSQWGYIQNYPSHTSNTNNFWFFSNMQLETKDHATGYAGVGGTRNSNIVYDTSGFGNNSTLNSNATISTDTAKYTHSTYFGEYNTPKTDLIDNSLLSALTNCTITWWEKNDTTRTLLLTGQSTSHYIAASDNNTYYHGTVGGTKTLYRDGVAGTYKCEAGVWHHYALVGVDISTWTALHLNSYGSYWYLKGLVSDLRIYATALSADDVLSLYQNSAYIDSSGNIYGKIRE